MPLQQQSVNLVLYQGIDTKTNSKLVEGKLLELENCEINNQEIVKSPGNVSLADAQTESSDPRDQKGILNAFGTLIVADNTKLYKYNSEQDVLNEVDNLCFAKTQQFDIAQNISENFTVPPSFTPFSQLYSPITTFNYVPLTNYVLPAPVSCEFGDYFFIAVYVVTESDNFGYYDIKLIKKSTQTVLFNTQFATSSFSDTIQDAVGTPEGIFMYTVRMTTGQVDEYFLSYDLSTIFMTFLSPLSANIFPSDPVLTATRAASPAGIPNLSSYINYLQVEYANGYLFFAFRTGTLASYNGVVASRNIGGIATLPPTAIITGQVFDDLPKNQGFCTCTFYHPITQTYYFSVLFNQRCFVIPTGVLTQPGFNPVSDIAVFFDNTTVPAYWIHSIAFLEKTTELVQLVHDIGEFVDLAFGVNDIAPTVNLFRLDQTTGVKLSATPTLTNSNDDARYLSVYGASAIAGRVFCVYDKIFIPIMYFAYIWNGTSDVQHTPNKDKRNSSHLMQVIPTRNVAIPANGSTKLSHVTWIEAFDCSLFNAKSGTNQGKASPPTIMKQKFAYISPTEATTNVFYGFFVISKIASQAGQVGFDHKFNAYNIEIPDMFSLDGFNRSAFYFGSNKINELTQGTFSEQGFFDFPQILFVSDVAAPPNNIPTGKYLYAAHYEWFNGNGEVVRSEVQELLHDNVGNAQSITFQFTPPPFFSNKTGMVLKLYRSTINGSVPFLETSLPYPTSTPFTYTDAFTDAQIQFNEIVYTYGGILGDQPFPAVRAFTLFNDCIFAVDANEPNRIRFSKPRTEGVALATNDALSFLVDTKDGEVTNIGVIDQKLILFKDNSIFVVEGTVPTDDGLNGTLTAPQFISTPVGCSQIETVVTFPFGLIFKSKKGLWQLDRSLNSTYIGADVEAYNNLFITSSQVLTTLNKIKFATSNGTILVYDYYYNTWNVETYETGIKDMANVEGSLILINENGELLKQTPNLFLRDNKNYRAKFTTGWIKLAGLIGFQRVFKILFLGNYTGSHVLKASVSFNYNDQPTEFHYFNPKGNLGTINPFNSQPWGTVIPYAGYKDSTYLFRINVRQQKCVSVKISFEDVFVGEADQTGASFKATSLNFDIGVKSPTAKVPSRLQV